MIGMKYASLFRIRFINGLQYRLAAYAGIATQFAWGGMEVLLFHAFYRANPAAFPMAFEQLAAYIWLQQAFLALFMVWFLDTDIFDAITDGNIAYELARPMDLYGKWFTQNLASRTSKAALRCIPILLVAAILPAPYRLAAPAGAGSLFLFLLTMALGLGVVVSFCMLLYIATFYTMSSQGIRLLAVSAVEFLSGSLVPLPFLPEGMRRVLELLPFASMQNLPLRIYSGNIAGLELLWGIGLQVFWLVILTLTGIGWTRQALRRVAVQGG